TQKKKGNTKKPACPLSRGRGKNRPRNKVKDQLLFEPRAAGVAVAERQARFRRVVAVIFKDELVIRHARPGPPRGSPAACCGELSSRGCRRSSCANARRRRPPARY